MNNFPNHAEVVVIGAGVAGANVAYQLAKQQISDVVVLERKSLVSGTTYHAAGMVRELQSTPTTSWMSRETNKTYAQLQAESGMDIHYRRVGSLYVSNHPDRMLEFKRSVSKSKSFGIESHSVTPQEVKSICPILNTKDILGGYFMPNDAVVNPYLASLALLKVAENLGVVVLENVNVERINEQSTGNSAKAISVTTSQGTIQCNHVVICGGMWSRDFSKATNINIPLHAAEHYYVLSEPLDGIDLQMPAVRDLEARSYIRPAAGTYWYDGGLRLMCGFFEAKAKPWGMDGIDEDLEFIRLPEDWGQLEDVLAKVKNRVPALQTAKFEMLFNGPESFTYDNSYFVGLAPNKNNVYVATGFCSRGIQAAGGAAQLIANQIVNNRSTLPGVDTTDVNVNRCSPFTANKKYLYDRTIEGLGLLFDFQYPYKQLQSARGIRKTPLHDRLAVAGACFGEASGWERANFYIPDTPSGETPKYQLSYGKQNWFVHNEREHQHTRNAVSFFDLSSFVKFLVQGKDSAKLLNQLCCSQIDVPVGKIIYTQALNEWGGIEADWTVTRIAEDAFWVISAVTSQNRDMQFFKRHISENMAVTIADITSAFATLAIMGPNSRKVMQAMSGDDFSNQAFPLFTSQTIDFGYARAVANRISYVGELGWEVFVPTEFALNCYDQLMEAGKAFNLQHAGYHTLTSMRLEKTYRHWGDDISDVDTPLEAGLGFTIDFDKPEFNGKQRLLEQREKGLRKRMICLQLDPSCDKVLHQHEPIYRNGNIEGFITSGAFCHTLGCYVGLGYIDSGSDDRLISKEELLNSTYEVELFCEKHSAQLSLKPPFDPSNSRMKA